MISKGRCGVVWSGVNLLTLNLSKERLNQFYFVLNDKKQSRYCGREERTQGLSEFSNPKEE